LEGFGLMVIPPARVGSPDLLWKALLSNIRSADGAAVFAVRQLRVDSGRWRPGTIDSALPSTWWPSPWTYIEAGMAVAEGLPLLIVREDGVEGAILDPPLWGDGIYGTETSAISRALTVTDWVSAVLERVRFVRSRTILSSGTTVPV
jgi:hypothetical protein